MIILFGPNGMLGRYIRIYFERAGYGVVAIDRSILDADSISAMDVLDKIFEPYKIDSVNTVVINCVGAIPQRVNQEKRGMYLRVNTIFPNVLANYCHIFGFQMYHITTDCVFTGKDGDYTESSVHDETGIYGLSKSLGESQQCCNIRTSIIGEEVLNKKSLLEWVRSQNGLTINGFICHYWNGVTCLQLAKILEHLIRNKIWWRGVRHFHSPKAVSKYELVKMIIDVYGLQIELKRSITELVDKTLGSEYQMPLEIPDIRDQIVEQCAFSLD